MQPALQGRPIVVVCERAEPQWQRQGFLKSDSVALSAICAHKHRQG